MIRPGDIVTLKEAKRHQLIPFEPGEQLRVVRVSKWKDEKKRVFCESIDQKRCFELYPSQVRMLDMLEVDGKLRSMESWAKDIGIKVAALKDRLKYGWPARDAVKLPRGTRMKLEEP